MHFNNHPISKLIPTKLVILKPEEILAIGSKFRMLGMNCEIIRHTEKAFQYKSDKPHHPKGWISWKYCLEALESGKITL